MSKIAYVNGRYLPHGEAAVHIEDRGYQFGDGVYEVCQVLGGRLIDERRHLARLQRSLVEMEMSWPMAPAALGAVLREVVRRNRVDYGLVYLQVTRGVAPRNHAFPPKHVRPSIVVTARSVDRHADERRAGEGVAVITVPDNRWERVDIKTITLLPNVLAKQKAKSAGAFEAWLIDRDGFVTEGSSTNAWIVTAGGKLVTRSADFGILRGVTRAVVIDAVRKEKLGFEERQFSVKEALAAREAFITSASTIVMPVTTIDGKAIGAGKPGPMAKKLRAIFHNYAETAAEWSRFSADKPESKQAKTKKHA